MKIPPRNHLIHAAPSASVMQRCANDKPFLGFQDDLIEHLRPEQIC